MEITLSKIALKKSLAVLMAFLIAMSTMWTGLAVVSFAAEDGSRNVTAGNVTKSGKWGDNINYTLYSDGRLVLEGTGKMKDGVYGLGYENIFESQGDYESDELVKSIEIGSGITSIGCAVFSSFSDLTEVTIPDSVTLIGHGTFYDCTSLTSITIPDSVTSIGDWAFDNCTSLESITIPDSVTTIGFGTFYNCESLKSITIPDSVTSIGDHAFYNCKTLESITIPDSVTSIGDYAFYNCTALTSITIPDSVTSIGSSAFEDCTSLTSITIPDSVTSIGSSAFRDCTALSSITIPDSVTSTDPYAFDNTAYYNNSSNWENDVLYIDKHFIKAKTSISGAYEIKSGTKTIADSAFRDCTALSSITIPDSVTSIGWSAFEDCTALSSITIPDSVTSIGDYAFIGCTSLKSITIPDSVTSIGRNAFYDTAYYNNSSNRENDVLYIDNHLIEAEASISGTYEIKSGTKTIADSAFSYCTSLKSITIPDSVTSIGEEAFYNCTALSSITIPDSVTLIGYGTFYDCTSLTSITIPDSVTSIGDWAFDNCTSLESITIPDSVTLIGYGTFYDCTSLTSITIPDSVTSIGDWAFDNCTSLSSITIPDSVTSIGDDAFYNCESLDDVYYYGTREQWTNINIDLGNDALTDATIHYNNCENHDIISHEAKSATCTEKGWNAYVTCSRCDYTTYKEIPAKGHSFTEKIIDSAHLKAKATVERAAIYKYDCEDCDAISPDKTFTHGNTLALGVTSKVSATQNTSAIKLTWNKAENASGYRIYYKLPGDINWRNATTYLTETTITFTGLPAGQKYTFAIRSAYKKTDGTYILGGYKTIETATKAVKPSKVISAQNTSAIRLTWTACKGADGYRIYYKSGSSWKVCLSTTSLTTHTFTKLNAGAKYTFAVRPYIKIGSTVIWSDYTQFTTATTPAAVTAKASSTASGKVAMTWNAVNGADGYQVYYKVGNGSYKLYKTYTSVQTLTFSGLKSGTQYTFAVRAGIKTSGGNIFGGYKTATVTVR